LCEEGLGSNIDLPVGVVDGFAVISGARLAPPATTDREALLVPLWPPNTLLVEEGRGDNSNMGLTPCSMSVSEPELSNAELLFIDKLLVTRDRRPLLLVLLPRLPSTLFFSSSRINPKFFSSTSVRVVMACKYIFLIQKSLSGPFSPDFNSNLDAFLVTSVSYTAALAWAISEAAVSSSLQISSRFF
jgi:hypothetical protein